MSIKHLISVTAVMLVFASLSIAQTAESTEKAQADSLKAELDQIIVTASKLPMSRRETTRPVIIIERRELERSSGSDISQILNRQSGIRVNDAYGSPANSRILYMQGATAQNTLILLDGKPVTDPSGVGGLFDLRLLPVNQLERIEVIKGSQSTLYGTDAIAGVINLISAEPAETLFGASTTFSYGSFNTIKGSAAINGSAGNILRYYASYNRESSDGFSAAEVPDGADEFGDDGYRMNSFFSRVEILAGDSFTFTPFLNYSGNNGDYDGGAFQDAENSYELEMLNPGVRSEFSAGDLRVRTDYGYTRTTRLFLSQFGENQFEGRFHDADIYADYNTGDHTSILTGFNYQDYNIPAAEEGGTGRGAWIASPYATFYLKDLKGLNAELGYRLNRHSEYGSNSTFSIAPSYFVTGNMKFYGSLSTGFKIPTPDELFGPFGANPELDPQKSLYLSLGLEAYLLQGSFKTSIQYFTREVDDVIIFTFGQGYLNRDRQNDRGLEVTADWLIGSAISVAVWYNYVDGEIAEQTESGIVIRNNLIRRPEHSFGLNTTVNLTDNLVIRIDGEWNGERSDLYFNPDNNFAQEDVILGAYTLVNFYTEYKLNKFGVTFFGDIKNLLNTDFTEVYGFNTMGTALKGGVRVRF
jgi:vitamin B12 transporter